MMALVPIFLLFWSTSPGIWNILTLIAQFSGSTPGLLSNAFCNFNQVPTILATSAQLPWSVPYPEGFSPSSKLGTNKPPFSDLTNPLPAAVPGSSLPSLLQVPTLDPNIPPTWGCSLWLLTGALVMALDTYFPPFSQPVSFGRPFQAAIPVLHWMASWWLVPPGWEPDFVSLAPLSYISQAIYLVFEALLVVNYQLHVDLGCYFPPHGDFFIISKHFCHSVSILTNWLANEVDDGSDLPYDLVICATITCCLSSISNDVIFISYDKLSLQFQDYGTLSKTNTPKGKNKKPEGIVIGVFLAVSPKGTVFYQTTTSYTNGYWYRKFLSDLLATWSSVNSSFKIFLSHQMKCNVAFKKIKADGHDVSIFPARYANLHLGDVLFFNIGDTICGSNLMTFSQVVSVANNNTLLFPCHKVANMFTNMHFCAFGIRQSQRDSQLPPCDSPVYKPITVLSESEYDIMHHEFLRAAQSTQSPLDPSDALVPS
ncbi:hypothetical protein DSO57_1030986 [Entomophthora muscae]|uniref:Uncharacterized protein n=1 Tax=Entomophthora muscae TaxID=34485 RepID=A0ACC2SDP5_9FUNG|nr:hypothetical protein DSO57_1030986 [Entomophthora muscae]